MLTCKVGKKIVDTFSYEDNVLREWSNKSLLKCPVCGAKMIYCHGNYKEPYFKHEINSDCPDIYSEGVTQEHIEGIKTLYSWLKSNIEITDIELEKWIPETKQRPDIYFKYKEKEYCIEYQCSPISTKYAKRRELYRLQGINDIWILGTIKYFEESSNYLEKIIHRKNSFEKRFKTIESEIINEHNLIYLNSMNNRIYITNKDITKNAIRIKTAYHSGKSYEDQLKTIYKCNLKSSNIYNIVFDNILNLNIKNIEDNYIEIVINSELNIIKQKIYLDNNLKIIEDHNNIIKYIDVKNKEYTIKYNKDTNEVNGFKYNNENILLSFRNNDGLRGESIKHFYNFNDNDYFIEGNEIKLNKTIDEEFDKLKRDNYKKILIKNEGLVISYLDKLKEYIKSNNKYIDDIIINSFERNEHYIGISIKFLNNIIKRIEYSLKNISIKEIYRDINSYINNNIKEELPMLNLLYGLKNHYDLYLDDDDYDYMDITQTNNRNGFEYEFNIAFSYYDKCKFIIDKNTMIIDEEKYHYTTNKKEFIMNKISYEIRKRKYRMTEDK